MLHELITQVKSQTWHHYNEQFNFFQSKSINLILGSRKIDHVVHYRDLEFLGDQTQYLKRYYLKGQTTVRVSKLINYYQSNMTPPVPNMLPLDTYPILETHHRRTLKLCMLKEKERQKQRQREKQKEKSLRRSFIDGSLGFNIILGRLDQSSLSESDRDDSGADSWDSEGHYVYEQMEELVSENGDHINDMEIFNTAGIGNYVYDFKGYQGLGHHNRDNCNHMHQNNQNNSQVSQICNISLPSHTAQTSHLNLHPPSNFRSPQLYKQLQQKQLQIETMKQAAIKLRQQNSRLLTQVKELQSNKLLSPPQNCIKKQSSPPPPPSLVHSQHPEATESIGVDSVTAEGGGGSVRVPGMTFMDYYNSIPQKKPSNILEKYIKRKK